MAGTVISDRIEAATGSQLVLENGVALTPPTISDVNNVEIGRFCRAWVNFNGTLAAASMVRDSFNVSSITDGGVGIYTINFINAMPDANYVMVGGGGSTTPSPFPIAINNTAAPTTSACRLIQWYMTGTTNQAPADGTWNHVSFFS